MPRGTANRRSAGARTSGAARARRTPTFESLEARLVLDGSLDFSFGGSGGVEVPSFINPRLNAFGDGAYSVAIQPDGKIVVAGYATDEFDVDHGAVARLNQDGSLDRTFGQTGEVVLPASFGELTNVAIDSRQNILLAGASKDQNFAVVRIRPDGKIDTPYGSGGEVTVAFSGGAASAVDAVTVQSDGKVLLAGYAYSSQGFQFALARLNADGSVDTTLNRLGRETLPIAGTATAVAVGPGGTIVVAGNGDSGDQSYAAFAKLRSDGAPDEDANQGGLVVDTATPNFDTSGLAVGPDGSIFLLGRSHFTVRRYSPAGKLDTSFGQQGQVANIAGSGSSGEDIEIGPNGNLYFGGAADTQSGSVFIVARLKPDGSRDASFGSAGVAAVAYGVSAQVRAIALQNDGRVVAAGRVTRPSDPHDTSFQLARFVGGEARPPVLHAPSAPALDSGSDTGPKNDGQTSNRRPTLTGRADPGRLIVLYRAGESTAIGTTTVSADGTYAVSPSATLALGSYTLFAREGDGEGYLSAPGAASSLTIVAGGVSPTLVVLTHGQYTPDSLELEGLGAFVSGFNSALGTLIASGTITYQVLTGAPITGSGRDGGETFQFGIAARVKSQLAAAEGGQGAGVASLVVDWDTYGSIDAPAQSVADRVQQIVGDSGQFDGKPWDILFVGYSRGGPFNDRVMRDLDLANNARVGYVESILIDPTASSLTSDPFPQDVPDGVDREIVYDDGLAFPASKIGGRVFGLKLPEYPLLAVDSNSARIDGAEYRNVTASVKNYVGNGRYTGDSAYDSYLSHSNIQEWYYRHPAEGGSGKTNLELDVAEFIARKDAGAARVTGGGSGFTDLDVSNPKRFASPSGGYVERIQPPSSAVDLSRIEREVAEETYQLYNDAVKSAIALANQLVNQAKALGGQISAEAKKLGNQLIADAKRLGAEALAEARAQSAKLAKAAQAEVKALVAQAQAQANSLYKQGKLFGKGASATVTEAAQSLKKVQQQSQRQINKAQKAASKAVGATAEAAKAHLAQVQAAAEAARQAALAKLAQAAAAAQNLANSAAEGVQNAYDNASSAVSSGYSSAKKRLGL
jgi:uncharacterized delta-60 repeat protein